MNKISFKETFLFWLKLGFISFGGPAGQIAIMHEYLVEKKKWISETKFLHALNYCMLLPGPEAQQLATYTGWLMHGTIGGIVAGLLFILPSVFILLGLSMLYVTFGKTAIVFAMLNGIKPAVVAIVFLALLKIGEKALKKKVDYLFALASLIALLIFKVPYPLVILGAIILGFVYLKLFEKKHANADKGKSTNTDESGYLINANTVIEHTRFNRNKFIATIIIFVSLWVIPVVLFYFFSADFVFWKQLSLFFTKAALVTFGGAYSVLLYVSQIAVEKMNWLTHAEMIDGLALGETTPGPLIMVLVFVGFMGSYKHFNLSLFLGSVGLLATTFFTFLPSFAFILLGAPLIEKTQENKFVKQCWGL